MRSACCSADSTHGGRIPSWPACRIGDSIACSGRWRTWRRTRSSPTRSGPISWRCETRSRLRTLGPSVPALPLHIVGGGLPDQVRQGRAVAPKGVLFRGQLTSGDLAEAYRGATVAVFAPHREELGLAPLEAMASGVPVVAW